MTGKKEGINLWHNTRSKSYMGHLIWDTSQNFGKNMIQTLVWRVDVRDRGTVLVQEYKEENSKTICTLSLPAVSWKINSDE